MRRLEGPRALRVSHQITNFTSQKIGGFAWSRDGKRLAVARGESSSDVVLLQDSGR